jgi:diguanylate cyclase (GGDEF)-like protein
MAAFLETQLDFIFFFYGLAFILLGAVSFAIARGGQEKTDWTMLGLFGFVHGASEWLDLVALIITDGPGFAAVRTAVMTASYVFLAEFARQEAIRLGWKMPERWVYLPLVALVALAGILDGVPTANAVARYALGFGGAMATGFMFAWHARGLSGDHRRLAISAAAGFAIYAVAAGAIAPAAPIWPATVLNHQWFIRSTGIPIQLIRGLLACWIAFSVWAIWGQKLVQELSSARYTRFVQRQFTRTLMAMGTIVVSGWLLTNYLGEIYNQNVQADASNDLNLLSSRLAAETAITDGMARLLAGAPSIHGLLKEGKASSGRHMLDLTVEASGAELGYIVDRAGTVVATAGKLERAARDPTYAGAPSIQKSLAGEADHAFAFDAASGSRDYYASYPIRDGSDVVVGAAVLKKSLRGFEKSLANYDAIYFLLDPNGIVMLSNRLKYMLRSLWAVPVEKQLELTRQFGQLNYNPLVKREIAESGWTAVDGVRAYVSRRFFDRGQWSLAIVKPPERIYASRVLGIAITLLATVAALVYLLASERAVHDRVQMDKRLELQEMASDFRFRATTDALTGLNNRLRFNEAMSLEISRAQRYGTPLSLVLFDIDHFKLINDTHGHLAGDKVLVELSRFVARQIRDVDVLARWGGEEFAILLPESDASMACQFAQKLRESLEGLQFDEVGVVTCSFGVAQFEHADLAKTIVSRADKALYRAKLNGRNRVELAPSRSGVRPSAESAA